MESYLQVGVKAFLKNKSNKYLMLRASLKKYPEIKQVWGIVGGRINPGTPLIENLKREIKEETGLTLKGEPKLIAAQDILGVYNYPGRHVVRLTYIAEATGKLKIDKEEVDEFGWFTVEEMKKLSNIETYLKELFNKGIV
jgi:ADP-ribose pyrophosphatase YjhB (NUDIX family)